MKIVQLDRRIMNEKNKKRTRKYSSETVYNDFVKIVS